MTVAADTVALNIIYEGFFDGHLKSTLISMYPVLEPAL